MAAAWRATQCAIGDADPMGECCADIVQLPDLPVWLTTPAALRQTPRIRRVMDHLAQALGSPRLP